MNVAVWPARIDRADPLGVVRYKRGMRRRCSTLIATVDLLVIGGAFLAANLVYWQDPAFQPGIAIPLALVPAYLMIAALHRVFACETLMLAGGGGLAAIKAFLRAAVAVLSIAYLLKAGDQFSRGVFLIGLATTLVTLPLARLVTQRLARRVVADNLHSVIVIRDSVEYEGGEHELVLTPAEIDFDPDASDPFQFHRLAQTVTLADRLLVACPQERYERWSSILKSMPVAGEILTDQRDHLGLIGVGHFGQRSTMIVAAGPMHLGQRLQKRGFDIAVALAALVLAAPLMLATAIALRFDSRGPILFRQQRIGRANRIFDVFKFRSMYVDACDAAASQLTARGDPRVTRLGALLRRTSIDELPQLLNVLRGEMSIVGPRPHPLGARAADLLYWDVDPRYRHRHAIKPGLTGLAQVRGFRGNTERVEDLTNRLQADLEYALGWSLWRDIQILGRTLLVMRHHNAF